MPRELPTLVLALLLLSVASPALAQDDMLLRADQVAAAREEARVVQVTDWSGGRIPVRFDVASPAQRAMFFEACAQWSAYAGVSCVPHTAEPTYLRVSSDGSGCATNLGSPYPWAASSTMNLDPQCWTTRGVAHEIGHAFGLPHEHQRPDRDQFIAVNYANIDPLFVSQFGVLTTSLQQGPYDPSSVMHYNGWTGSRNGLETLSSRTGATLGGDYVSPLDGADLRMRYGPPAAAAAPFLTVVSAGTPATIQWTPNPHVTSYTVYASTHGVHPDLAIIQMGAQTSLTAVAPPGLRVYLAVMAHGAAGSVLSNIVTVTVR